MPIMSRTTALTIYQTTQHKAITDALLRKAAFVPIDQTSDAISVGFAPFGSPMDTEAPFLSNRGHYTAFHFRVDQRRVAAAVIRKHLDQALTDEKAAMADSAKKFISKDRKREIKERVLLQLMSRAEPVPAVHDVVVDLLTGRVYFTSASKRAKEQFEGCWFGCFRERLAEMTPEELAGGGLELTMEMLGFKFLTGLREDNATVENPFGEDNATVENPFGEVEIVKTATLSGDSATVSISVSDSGDLDAAMSAMEDAQKSQVTKAGLRLSTDGMDFELTLRAADFGITGLRPPKTQAKPEEGDGPDALFLEKMYLLEVAVNLLHRAFKEAVGTGSGKVEDDGEDF